MAKTRKHVSLATENNEKGGGKFGFPPGAVVTINEAKFTTWEEAIGSEKAAKRKFGDPEDPCLYLVGDVEGMDEPRDATLGAGRKTAIIPSEDGEFLEPVEVAEGINDGTALAHFMNSLQDKKTLGKLAYTAEEVDAGASALVGLKFVAGSKKVDRSDMPDRDPKKGSNDAVLIVAEIIEKPGTGSATTKKAKAKTKPAPADDDDEGASDDEDEAPAPKKKGAAATGKVNLEEKAEEMVTATLSDPKNRKGIAKAKIMTAVYSKHQDDDDPNVAKALDKFVGDDDWLLDEERPWAFDKDAKLFTLPE